MAEVSATQKYQIHRRYSGPQDCGEPRPTAHRSFVTTAPTIFPINSVQTQFSAVRQQNVRRHDWVVNHGKRRLAGMAGVRLLEHRTIVPDVAPDVLLAYCGKLGLDAVYREDCRSGR